MSTEVPERAALPSVAVVEAVAAREGVDPVALAQPLADAIDPDALDRLVRAAADRPARSPFHVAFPYHGFRVVVSADGTIDLHRGADDRSQ